MRKVVRGVVIEIGLNLTDTTRLVTAASELARNILQHAGSGAMQCKLVHSDQGGGIELVFSDEGPGIADVELAMQAGYTTSTVPSLGLGLPGTRRLVDSMEVNSQPGEGTTVKICKWQNRKLSR